MKIRMMTFHTPKNYGAVLQAYSLMHALERYSDDVRIIDYNTPALRAKYPLFPRVRSVKQLVKALTLLPSYPGKAVKYRKFSAFVDENLKLTKRYESLETLENEIWDADTLFTTGSDQVFNPNRSREEQRAFYLDFTPPGAYTMSYAGSFGVRTVPDEKKEQISKYLRNIRTLLVREESGRQIAHALDKRGADVVLDPVFLGDRDFWSAVEKPHADTPKDYVLYYRLLNRPDSDQKARRVAAAQKKQLVVITETRFAGGRSITVFGDVGPQEFLSLFHGAACVVTDSFHGAAFSLIYQKQFLFTNVDPVLRERGANLLRSVGLDPDAHLGDAIPATDYAQVGPQIKRLIDASRDKLTAGVRQAEQYYAARRSV